MIKLRSGSSSARNTVEVLSFLKEPASITATLGTKVYTYDAPAGMYSKTFPLEIGTNRATIKRGGAVIDSVTSPWAVKSRQHTQDLQYYGVTSGR